MSIRISCGRCGLSWEVADWAYEVICPNPNCGATNYVWQNEPKPDTKPSEPMSVGATLIFILGWVIAIALPVAILYIVCEFLNWWLSR